MSVLSEDVDLPGAELGFSVAWLWESAAQAA